MKDSPKTDCNTLSRNLTKFSACLSISVLLVALGGCVGGPDVYEINGQYYALNKKDCKTYRESGNGILCYDKNSKATSYASPMTSEQLQMYVYQRQQAIQASQAMVDMANQNQPRWGNYPNYGADIPQPTFNQKSTTTYRQIGNTIYGSDGSKCQVIGNTVKCSN